MHIEIVPDAASNVAPATESASATGVPENSDGSFAGLLDAVADEQTGSSVDEGGEDESAVEAWITAPVVVPFIPVIPLDVVEPEEGDATSVEAIDEEIAAADADTPLPEPLSESLPEPLSEVATPTDVKPFDVKPFVEVRAEKPTQTPDESKANKQPASLPAVDEKPFIAREARPEAAESDGQTDGLTPAVSDEPVPTMPTATPAKAATPAHDTKTAGVNDTVDAVPAAAAANNAMERAISEGAASRAESTPETSNEPARSPKDVAARFSRAIERAVEHAVAPTASAGEESRLSNQNGEGQSSFGEWLREQFPQLGAARGKPASHVITHAAPAQNDARTSGLLASTGASIPSNATALPNQHDVTLQLVQSMRMQFRDGIGEAVLKLKPEHLGSVSLSLKVENGGLKVNVQADMPAVRQWLESHQDLLRSALAEHGLRLDRFDVEPDAQRQHTGENTRDEQSTRRRRPRRTAQEGEPVFEVVV